jgi:alkanesulfonate monooxygenase SsuD/methylene tetrahydromethanopterin reductase-like flavin-dependent oxidoreductase (luciferase family)
MSADYQRAAPVRPGLFIFFVVHEDREVAIDMATKRLSRQYNQDFSKLVHKYAIAGNPDDCAARLREYIDAGAGTIILNSATTAAYTDENEALMAQAVLPVLKQG